MPIVLSKKILLRIPVLKMLIKIITLNEVWEVLSKGQWGKVPVGERRRKAGQHKLVQQHSVAAGAVRAVLLHETMVCPQQLQPGAQARLDYTACPIYFHQLWKFCMVY